MKNQKSKKLVEAYGKKANVLVFVNRITSKSHILKKYISFSVKKSCVASAADVITNDLVKKAIASVFGKNVNIQIDADDKHIELNFFKKKAVLSGDISLKFDKDVWAELNNEFFSAND